MHLPCGKDTVKKKAIDWIIDNLDYYHVEKLIQVITTRDKLLLILILKLLL